MSEDEKKYECPNCDTECGSEDIYGCSTLRCPKCCWVFEPEYDGMEYEVDVVCPECVERIKLTSKTDDPAYMVCMGNGDYIGIACSKCGLRFYILEEDYNRMREKMKIPIGD